MCLSQIFLRGLGALSSPFLLLSPYDLFSFEQHSRSKGSIIILIKNFRLQNMTIGPVNERLLYYFFQFSSSMTCGLQHCQMEDLVKEYGICNGQEKKKKLSKCTDQQTEFKWKAFNEFADKLTFAELKELIDDYLDAYLFQLDSCVFQLESSGILGIPWNSWIPARIRRIWPESVEEWKVLEFMT